MKKIASKLGIWWFIIGLFPAGVFATHIMRAINIDDSITIIVAAALLAIQCCGAFMFFFYTDYVIGIKTPEPKKKEINITLFPPHLLEPDTPENREIQKQINYIPRKYQVPIPKKKCCKG